MLKSVEYGGGGPKVFGVVVGISSKLTEEDYEKQVLPVITRLFASPDRALRVCLLDSLSTMIDRIPKGAINDRIFPNIVTGFSDVAPLVREQTVKSILTIISKLSDRTINGELLKHLAKTANDAEPGIRTNTTICLGKIAKYLGPNTRTKVLVAAFTRSLKDPFIHARNAAVMALGATVDTFSEDDCASKILPALCPSLLDKEKAVRDQASKVIDQYLIRCRKTAQSMPDSESPAGAVNPSSTANGGPRMGTPANDSSWSGWAISSFTNKLSAADGNIQPNVKATVSGGFNGGRSSSPQSRPLTPSGGRQPVAANHHPSMSRQTTDTTRLAQSFTKPEVAVQNDQWDNDDDGTLDDGWEAMDDDADDGWGHADTEPTTTTTTSNSSSVPTSTTAARTSTAGTHDDGGEPDFAGWLKAQQSNKTKKAPLPKGLSGSKAATISKPLSKNKPEKPASQKPPPKTETAAPTEDDDWGDAWA